MGNENGQDKKHVEQVDAETEIDSAFKERVKDALGEVAVDYLDNTSPEQIRKQSLTNLSRLKYNNTEAVQAASVLMKLEPELKARAAAMRDALRKDFDLSGEDALVLGAILLEMAFWSLGTAFQSHATVPSNKVN